MLGEFLYSLNPGEARTQPVLQRVTQRGGGAGAALTVDATFPVVPLEKIFVVTNLSGVGIAGAAQTTTALQWNIIADATTDILSVALWNPNPPILQWGNSEMKNFVLMPGEFLRFRGTFNAAAAVNAISGSAFGFFLPKGTLQLR